MPILRQSTTQTVRFGPFLDITDGVTEETALTLAQADMRLSKDGGAFAQKSAAGNATHDSDGWYSTALSTTDTATVGELIMNVHQPANTLPVWMRWWVVEEAVYDAHYGAAATGPLQGTTAGNTLDVNATGEAGLDLDNTSGTIAAAQIATNAITAAKIATDAITAAKIEANAIGSSELATDAIGDAQIATGAIASTAFAAGAIDAAAIAADAIGSSELATDAIGDAQIATGAIASTAFAAGAIDASAIATDAIGSAELATSAVDEIKDAILPVTNATFDNIPVLMVLSSDHVSASTGLTLGITRSIDGAAFGAGTGTAAEIANGLYQYDASSADMNGTLIIFRFTGTASDDTIVVIRTGG